jgi:hypothetical protein
MTCGDCGKNQHREFKTTGDPKAIPVETLILTLAG